MKGKRRLMPRAGDCSSFRLHIFVGCHGIVMVLSDRATLQFGREAEMSTEPTMLYGRSRPSMANREEIALTPAEACRLIAICIDLIDLCAKVTGKIDPAVASIVGYARDEALSGVLKN